MIRLLLACLILALAPATALAQRTPGVPDGPHNETPVPIGLQGIWSGPDCTSAQQVYVIAQYYGMFHRPGIFRIGAVQSWRQEDDDGDMLYQFRTNSNNATLIKKTNDGLMKIRLIDVNPKSPLKSAWGMMEDQTAPEFAHCAKLFDTDAGINQDEVNAVFLLDTLYKACRNTTSATFKDDKACQKQIFDAVDTDKNKSLDHAELARIYRQLVLVMASSAFCRTIGYPDSVPEEAEEFANLALGTEKSLSFDQALAKLTDPHLASGRVFVFAEYARNAQNLLPFMPLPVEVKSCSLVEPSNQKDLGTVPIPGTVPVKAPVAASPNPGIRP